MDRQFAWIVHVPWWYIDWCRRQLTKPSPTANFRAMVVLLGLLIKLFGLFPIVWVIGDDDCWMLSFSVYNSVDVVLHIGYGVGYWEYNWFSGTIICICLKRMLVKTRCVYQTWENADVRQCLSLDLETKLFRRMPMKTESSMDLWEMPTSDVVWRRSLQFRQCQLA